MSTKIQNILSFLKNAINNFSAHYKVTAALIKQNLPKHAYKVISLEQDDEGNYLAVIQITNKQQIFRIKPEEILANDRMTDSFSQRDIRTLTYLGYLDINTPKYKILAKRQIENDNKILFAIQERGRTIPIIKTADQISSDETLLFGLDQKDAHMVGYTHATEQAFLEQNEKEQLLKTIEKSQQQ